MNNRRAQDQMMHDAAARGDGICGAAASLEALAHRTLAGAFIVGSGFFYRDEDELDDERPY